VGNAYSKAWCPQSLREAIFQIDPNYTDDLAGFWLSGGKCAWDLHHDCPEADYSVVVDYGCGIGRVLRYVRGEKKIGVDVSREMLGMAIDIWGGQDNVLFVATDGSSIPLGDETATFVYSLITLQHMDYDDVLKVCLDASRVLRKDGEVYLSFSAFGKIPARPGAKISRDVVEWTDHKDTSRFSPHQVLRYSEEELKNIAEQMNFSRYRILSKPVVGYPRLAIHGRK